MDGKTKERAIDLLLAKAGGSGDTYADIALQTGYGARQLKRLAAKLQTEGREAALLHGNSGRKPANAAAEAERRFLRKLKEPYPSITIAHFRDIYIEDVIDNPARADEVAELGLVRRSREWFRRLFQEEGWASPACRPARREEGRADHVLREPCPRRGMMAQIDASPFDWLGDGAIWSLHLAVDDATSETLGGWFMPHECTRGYARMLDAVVARHGAPRVAYSDRHSVFSARRGGVTQFAMMCEDLGMRVILAQTPQAKGRVERANLTQQLRLVNDAARFGVRSYEELNPWYNDKYAPYLNSKFAFRPADPRDDFIKPPDGFDRTKVFRARLRRQVRAGTIKYQMGVYRMVDADGVMLAPPDGENVDLFVDAITEEVYVEYMGRKYGCVKVAERQHAEGFQYAGNHKELRQALSNLRA